MLRPVLILALAALTVPAGAQRKFTGELLRFMGDRVVQCARGSC
jgi:hypothetical protein